MYGHYNIPPVLTMARCRLERLAYPVSDADGGLADAIYQWESAEKGVARYRLVGVHEWLPPLHVTVRNRRNHAERSDGTMDIEMEATLRRREWAALTALDDPDDWQWAAVGED